MALVERASRPPAASVPTFDGATGALTRRGREFLNRVLSDRGSKKRAKEILGERRGLEQFQHDVADLDRKIQNLQKITRKWRERDAADYS